MAHYTPASVSRLSVPALVLALAVVPCAARGADTVGPETCKACHPAAYEAWRASPHARAREMLPERSRADVRCLSCHAPDAADGIAGVSCEACHGAGRLYAAAYVMRDPELARALGLLDPGERSCAGCHTESTPSLVRFEYERKLPLIRHWNGDAAPRKR
jgi:formate-dependent nitrite reductase cytochrome c552 subunit